MANVYPVMVLLLTLACGPFRTTPNDGTDPTLHAVLVNGGGEPSANFDSHLEHLKETHVALQSRGFRPQNIDVFDSDGGYPEPDQTFTWGDVDGEWGLVGTDYEYLTMGLPLRDSMWEVGRRPATREALSHWRSREHLTDDDVLLFWVTDHGTEQGLSLWYEDLLHDDLPQLLDTPAREVVVMNQCYAGGFSDVLEGDQCGLFAVPGDRMSFGCYPMLDERTGHAFAYVEALKHASTLEEAHGYVSLWDDAPDVPMLSSDVLLARHIDDEQLQRLLSERSVTRLNQLEAVHLLTQRFELPVVETVGDLKAAIERDRLAMEDAEYALGAWFEVLATANGLLTDDLVWPDVDALPPDEALRVASAAVKDHAGPRWGVIQRLKARVEQAQEAYMARSMREAVRQRQLVMTRRVATQGLPHQVNDRLEQLKSCETETLGAPPAPAALDPQKVRWRDHEVQPPEGLPYSWEGVEAVLNR